MIKQTKRILVNRLLALAAVVVTALMLAVPNARAERELVDRVVAIVEDEAVFLSEVKQGIKQMQFEMNRADFTDAERVELEKNVVQQLISNKLILAKAKQLGIEIPFQDVERAIDRAIDENKKTLGGAAAFEQQLKSEGLDEEALRRLYREQLTNRMLVERVLATEINRGTLQITDEELRVAYAERKNELPLRPAVVHLRTIYISMDSSESAQQQARARVDELRQRIMAGEDFGEVAKEYSEDPSSERGGSLGTLNLSDLSDEDFAMAAARLDIGEVSEPVLTSFGFHLIQITGKDDDSGDVDLRHILVRVNPGDDDVQTVFAEANDIHDQLIEGGDFEALAREHSDDKNTAKQGGDLGWLREEDLPEFFRDVLAEMRPGELSQVLREPAGFRIVQLLDREGVRPYEFEEVQEELRQLIEQEKMAASYDTYLQGLRDEFFVQVVAQ